MVNECVPCVCVRRFWGSCDVNRYTCLLPQLFNFVLLFLFFSSRFHVLLLLLYHIASTNIQKITHQKLEELNNYPDFNNYLIFVLTKLTSEGTGITAYDHLFT